jgi:DNA-binding PadR family transcriptional regulator
MKKIIKRSPIALAALAMLYEAPMHPYRMQQLIKERGKDEVINVGQRASLYQTIGRLEREGLISAQKVTRDENRPERTVYELTDAGRAITLDWMREILSTPAPEFPEFPAAISFLPLLTPKDALRQLELRALALQAEMSASMNSAGSQVPFLGSFSWKWNSSGPRMPPSGPGSPRSSTTCGPESSRGASLG